MARHQFDSSGRLKSASPEALEKADAGASIIAYTNGVTDSGRPYYAYLAVKPSRYREFYEKSKARQPMRLGDYGKIVVYGYESSPPASVMKLMRDKHGFDEQYEARLRQEVERERGQFTSGQEEKRLMDIVAMMKAKNAANHNG